MAKKPDTQNGSPLTKAFLKAHAGGFNDHQMVAVLELGANEADLEEALAWDMGESDLALIVRRPLSGKAEKIYEILNWYKPALEEERNS